MQRQNRGVRSAALWQRPRKRAIKEVEPPVKVKARANQRAEVEDEKEKEKGAIRPLAFASSATSPRRPMPMGSSAKGRPSRRRPLRRKLPEELRKEVVPQ